MTIPAELLAGGEAAFDRILARVATARRTITLRCFEWRDDDTGAMMARALLAAADRGVKITILKDVVGATYEYYEGSRQSFFHKSIDWRTRLEALGLMTAYGSVPWISTRPSALSETLLAHPNIHVDRDRRRFDHAKVYIIDDDILFVGGIGIGNDSRLANLDFMVEISGTEQVARYHARVAGRVDFDRSAPIDFLLHNVAVNGQDQCPLAAERLRMIRDARRRLTIEMAYLGDPPATDALVDAVARGVAVTLVTGARTNIIGDLNLATCDELLRRSGAPPHLRVVLHQRRVHSKVLVIDDAIAEIGSANFTALSHGGYDEVDVCIRDATFASRAQACVLQHAAEGATVGPRVPFNRLYAAVERVIVRGQSRPQRP